MHEYSLIQSLLERVEREAQARQATAVKRLWVRLGSRSGVERELFESAYEVSKRMTLCETAELVIDTIEARWECRVCGKQVFDGEILSCGDCGAPARLAAGGEIFLDSIEMEVS